MLISRPTQTTLSLRDVSLLIVDESIIIRNVIKWALKSSDAGAIRDAADGAGALRVLEGFSPDVILVNWRTQPVDGLAFVRRVRNSETGAHAFARIVMLSKCRRYRQVLAARDAGVDEFLVKPLSRAGLLAGIRAVIDNPRPFSRTDGYFGPDRRRKQIAHDGPERRKCDETVLPAPPGPIGETPTTQETLQG
jgi:two-component system, chemotaxis family, chemotaxis protein CheY